MFIMRNNKEVRKYKNIKFEMSYGALNRKICKRYFKKYFKYIYLLLIARFEWKALPVTSCQKTQGSPFIKRGM
jgi:hypothetical protein